MFISSLGMYSVLERSLVNRLNSLLMTKLIKFLFKNKKLDILKMYLKGVESEELLDHHVASTDTDNKFSVDDPDRDSFRSKGVGAFSESDEFDALVRFLFWFWVVFNFMDHRLLYFFNVFYYGGVVILCTA